MEDGVKNLVIGKVCHAGRNGYPTVFHQKVIGLGGVGVVIDEFSLHEVGFLSGLQFHAVLLPQERIREAQGYQTVLVPLFKLFDPVSMPLPGPLDALNKFQRRIRKIHVEVKPRPVLRPVRQQVSDNTGEHVLYGGEVGIGR